MVRIYAFIVTAHNTARLNKMPMVMITQDRRERARAANKRGPTVGRKGTGGGGGPVSAHRILKCKLGGVPTKGRSLVSLLCTFGGHPSAAFTN